MRKSKKILGIVFLVCFVVIITSFFIIKSLKIPDVNVMNVDLGIVEDGFYTGEYSAGPVKAVVQVEIKDNSIVDIIIEEHQNGLGQKAEKIIDDIIKNQTLDVDVVSGATLSSNVIRKATEEALKKAY